MVIIDDSAARRTADYLGLTLTVRCSKGSGSSPGRGVISTQSSPQPLIRCRTVSGALFIRFFPPISSQVWEHLHSLSVAKLSPSTGGKRYLFHTAGIPTPTPFLTGKIAPLAGRFPAQIRFCAVNTLFIYSWIILQTIHTNRRFLMLQ